MWLICSSCGTKQQRYSRELRKAARARCLACGGPLNTFREAVDHQKQAKENDKQAKKEANKPRQLKGGLGL